MERAANHNEAMKHVFSSSAAIGRGPWLSGSFGRGEKARRGGRGAVGGEKVLVFLGEGGAASDCQLWGDLAPQCPKSVRVRPRPVPVRCREWRGKDGALRSGPLEAPKPPAVTGRIPPESSAHDEATHHGASMALKKTQQQLSAISMATVPLKRLKRREGDGGEFLKPTRRHLGVPALLLSAGNRRFSVLGGK
jgi:hypothetical protein